MKKLVITLTAAAAIIVPAAQSADNQVVSPDDRSQARATSTALLPVSASPDDRAFNRDHRRCCTRSAQGPDDRAVTRATVDLRKIPTPVQVDRSPAARLRLERRNYRGSGGNRIRRDSCCALTARRPLPPQRGAGHDP